MHYRATHKHSSSHHAQGPTPKMQPHENVADRTHRRKSGLGSSILSLISPCLSKRPQRRLPKSQDDFRRDVRIIIPHQDGNEGPTKVHEAIFDTGTNLNFINERLVRGWYGAQSCSGHDQHAPTLPTISTIDGSQIQVRGKISLRFRVQDKPCVHKKIFAQCRFIKADFLIVGSPSGRCGFEAIIGLDTYQQEGLDEHTTWCFLGQGGRREAHPEMAKDSDREIARQRQRDSKAAEEVEQSHAEALSDRRVPSVTKAKKRKKRFGRRS